MFTMRRYDWALTALIIFGVFGFAVLDKAPVFDAVPFMSGADLSSGRVPHGIFIPGNFGNHFPFFTGRHAFGNSHAMDQDRVLAVGRSPFELFQGQAKKLGIVLPKTLPALFDSPAGRVLPLGPGVLGGLNPRYPGPPGKEATKTSHFTGKKVGGKTVFGTSRAEFDVKGFPTAG